MIKKTDLRIGNIVHSTRNSPNVHIEVCEIGRSGLLGKSIGTIHVEYASFSYSDLHGINLTETDLLEQYGFEVRSRVDLSSNYDFWCSNGAFDIRIINGRTTVYLSVGGARIIQDNIKCIHQLQNAYYCYVGKELKKVNIKKEA